ncbi:hypothetical protein T09_10964 [Trichinella sp. T9]|nr:hypothetical protein T09_10964 [Trichinella sp. T9]
MFTLKCNRRKGTVENLNFSLRLAVTLSAYFTRLLKLDDDQLKDYEKQVKPNDEDIEETGQDKQAMETDDEKSSNSVIENESELTVSESRQSSMLDEEKKAGEYVRNINAAKVNEGVF